MAKLKNKEAFKPFSTKLTAETRKSIKLYAANNDMKLYEAVEEAIKKGVAK
jgi:hypothetical protein